MVGPGACLLEREQGLPRAVCHREPPGVRTTTMEATYLAWLDCRRSAIPGNPFEYFLANARVALNDGADYGRGGKGFVRLNFACSRKTLTQALDRMRDALKKL